MSIFMIDNYDCMKENSEYDSFQNSFHLEQNYLQEFINPPQKDIHIIIKDTLGLHNYTLHTTLTGCFSEQ